MLSVGTKVRFCHPDFPEDKSVGVVVSLEEAALDWKHRGISEEDTPKFILEKYNEVRPIFVRWIDSIGTSTVYWSECRHIKPIRRLPEWL